MKRWIKLSICLLVVGIGLVVVMFYAVGPLPTPLFPNDYSTVILDTNGKILRVFLNDQQQWILPDDGREIPDKLKIAVTHYEDKRFYQHMGIDWLAVARALYQNISHGQRISGASTITMQVARLMQPKARTVKNKLIEMIQAVKIEFQYSKDEILKLYLLHAPYGGNIVGYRTASLRYFGKEPEALSWAEAATLAVLPNNPANINPMRNSDKLKQKRDQLLYSLYQAGKIDQVTYELAVAEPIPEGQTPFPLAAPHLTERLLRQVDQRIIVTTIDKEIQEKTARILKHYVDDINKHGVRNGAVLVVDTVSGAVIAYAASQDYFDQENLGMIDGIQMRRSSGSTLKPLLYALAMDEGLIAGDSVLPDIPLSYGGYTPFNADRRFRGLVRARDALKQSLNAPAVYLLNQYGTASFYEFLVKAGLQGLTRTPEAYGLSLILGSGDVSLWELARLYRGLGNFGSFTELHVIKGGQKEPQQLITPGSAYLVLEILKDTTKTTANTPIAWKTGTSYGNRDAWAVGVSPQWTIAVWVGNFDGSEAKGLTGQEMAAPLLFQVFNQLPKNPYQNWFICPADELTEVQVSEETGYRLKTNLGNQKTILVSAGAKPLRYSPYEKIVYLNQAGTMQVCSLCWDRADLQQVMLAVYPPEMNLNSALPPHNPDCPAVRSDNPLSFIYPQQDSFIFIPRDASGEYQRVNLEVAHTFKNSTVYWYLDDQYLGETIGVHRHNIVLETGWHKLYVVDTAGNSQMITFYAEKR